MKKKQFQIFFFQPNKIKLVEDAQMKTLIDTVLNEKKKTKTKMKNEQKTLRGKQLYDGRKNKEWVKARGI